MKELRVRSGGDLGQNCQKLETKCLKPMIQFRNLDIPSLVRILMLCGKNYAFLLVGMDEEWSSDLEGIVNIWDFATMVGVPPANT